LGKTGLKVSELCLGTLTFGTEWGTLGTDKENARKIWNSYVEAGGNFIDTANKYNEGTSEKWIGEFTKDNRDSYVISTKYSLAMNLNDPNSSGNHRKNLFHSVKNSLKRLNTDYIDFLWVHTWDYLSYIEEVMRALNDLVKMGKVYHIGISNTPAWIVAEANTLAREKGWTPFTALQLQYNLLERSIERELLPMARSRDLPIVAWSPLAQGVLTGKYNKKHLNEGVRRRLKADDPWGKEYLVIKNIPIVKEVLRIADKIEKTPAQVSLNWLLEKGVFPIIGARTKEQLIQNLGCLDFALTIKQQMALNKISSIKLGFPYDFFNNSMNKINAYGNIHVEEMKTIFKD
jgi:aryl-alcohol dehydrogenase-like predicted oxidoreductase